MVRRQSSWVIIGMRGWNRVVENAKGGCREVRMATHAQSCTMAIWGQARWQGPQYIDRGPFMAYS